MFYLFFWIFLILGGLVASIVLFFWAEHAGQFSDQGRARYLPLRGGASGGTDRASTRPYELIVLFAGASAVLLVTLFMALRSE